jgi:hypothetical protein
VEGGFRPSVEPQAHCCLGLAPFFWAISLGSRIRLRAAQLKTNSQSTLCSPRSFLADRTSLLEPSKSFFHQPSAAQADGLA